MLTRRPLWILILAGLCASVSHSGADEWRFLAQVPGAHYTYDLTATPQAVYMVLGDSLEATMGLYRYRLPTGQMQFLRKPAEPLYGVHVAGDNDEHIWLGGRSTSGEDVAVWHSPDGGKSWNPQLQGPLWDLYAVTGSETGNNVYVSSHNILCFKSSTDFGESWIPWGGCSNNLFGTRAMEADNFNPMRAYAAIMNWAIGGLFVVETTDAGVNWETVLDHFEPPSFGGVCPSAFAEGDFGVADFYGQIHVREDGVWDQIPETNLEPVFGCAQPVWDGGAWWISGMSLNDTIRVGRYNGSFWMDWDHGLPRVVLDGMEANANKARLWVYPMTGDVFLSLHTEGLWMYQNPASSVRDGELGGQLLSLVYPNPFRNELRVELQNVPASTYRLAVFSVDGRRVRNIHEGPLQGTSRWTWDGRGRSRRLAPNGVYFIRLVDAEGRAKVVEKILLMGR